MNILGIESSCDDTAAAVVTSEREIRSNIVWSQLKEHQPYGGVVPEIAARAHGEVMDKVIAEALTQAGISLAEIDVIAATGGPGLIGGVMVGMMTAKALSLATGKPLVAVNHLEGHALTVRLTDAIEFPYLLLLISGGHCQWLAVEDIATYHLLGATRDDALGEAFDKTAKMLGLTYPGGPQIEVLAAQGNSTRFALPRPLYGEDSCDFSFSGLKTAVSLLVQSLPARGEEEVRDVCAAFQLAASDCLRDRLARALPRYEALGLSGRQLVVAGGVAANQALRAALQQECEAVGYSLTVPPPSLCTDNAVMIAWAGYEHYRSGRVDSFDFEPRARWPLAAKAC